jgi:hypothetical protein
VLASKTVGSWTNARPPADDKKVPRPSQHQAAPFQVPFQVPHFCPNAPANLKDAGNPPTPEGAFRRHFFQSSLSGSVLAPEGSSRTESRLKPLFRRHLLAGGPISAERGRALSPGVCSWDEKSPASQGDGAVEQLADATASSCAGASCGREGRRPAPRAFRQPTAAGSACHLSRAARIPGSPSRSWSP